METTTSEAVVWEGSPSQLTNFGTYLACAWNKLRGTARNPSFM